MMTPPVRVIIVDDEAPAREGLRLRLRRETGVVLLGEFPDVASAIAAAAHDPPDVVFLDVEMPGLGGFDFVTRARELSIPCIVFTTAYEEYAVRAFRERALDYLLKPIEQERLRESLTRAREHLARLQKEELADRVRGLVSALTVGGEETGGAPLDALGTPLRAPAARIPVRTASGIQFVDVGSIDYIDAAGDAVRLHVGRVAHVARKSMGEIAAVLEPAMFCRIHRSTIVNVGRIRRLEPYFHGEYVVVLHDGTKLKLSRGYRAAVGRLLGLTDR